jgi:hypothetical protein
MPCRFKDRPNLAEYCACCSNHSRFGCEIDSTIGQRHVMNKLKRRYFRMTDPAAPVVDL